MGENKYRIDRSSVKGMTLEEANDHASYWKDKTPAERLNAACFIINQIFGVSPQTKVDRTITDSRKQS